MVTEHPIHGGPDEQGVPLHDFSTNSNACGPCPQALSAVQSCDASRYPDPTYTAVRQQLADFHGVQAWRVVLAGSASEFIYRITAWVAQARRGAAPASVWLPAHAYGDYAHAAQAWGCLRSASVEGAQLAWACDPSSPLGVAHMEWPRWLLGPPLEDRREASRGQASCTPATMVLDCAYAPLRLSGAPTLSPIQMDRVWQIWTPNKALGLTGVRAGRVIVGVLRRQLYLDRIIEQLTNGKKLDAAIKIILRLGLYQLIYLDKVPPHAVINDAVNLAVKAKKISAKGLVNAILRRFTREEVKLTFKDEIERVAVESSHPRWLIEKWIRQFGFAETEKLAGENNETPASVFRLTNKSVENTVEILKKLDLEIIESEVVQGAWVVSNSNEMLRVYAAEGKIYFQDEGSQLVARTVQLKAGESFLDVCAAPGSKATYVAMENGKWKMENAGNAENLLIAGDFYEHRAKVLQANCRRQGVGNISVLRYDAEVDLPFDEESFDVVLLDAPCSGTGTIRHNPEIRYFLQANDFGALAKKQLAILDNASKTVKRGGRLIYSTCSLEMEENEAVAGKFLAANSAFRQVSPEISERFKTAENFARTFLPTHKTDGFFIAVFEKSRVFDKV